MNVPELPSSDYAATFTFNYLSITCEDLPKCFFLFIFCMIFVLVFLFRKKWKAHLKYFYLWLLLEIVGCSVILR